MLNNHTIGRMYHAFRGTVNLKCEIKCDSIVEHHHLLG